MRTLSRSDKTDCLYLLRAQHQLNSYVLDWVEKYKMSKVTLLERLRGEKIGNQEEQKRLNSNCFPDANTPKPKPELAAMFFENGLSDCFTIIAY